MFERLDKIPRTAEEYNSNIFYDLELELREIIPTVDNYKSRMLNYKIYNLINCLGILLSLETNNNNIVIKSFRNNLERANSWAINHYSDFGLVINNAPKTRYPVEEDYKHMVSLEQFLKQTPGHFLKIYTTESSPNIIQVYTNKDLEPQTYYYLLSICMENYTKEEGYRNSLTKDLLKAFVDNDVTKIKECLNTYASSDIIQEAKYRKFKQAIRSNKTNQIRNLERDIASNRNNITDYENRIATLAVQIRNWSEELIRLTELDDDADTRDLYKYLLRHPYISSFRPNGTQLELRFQSPIIYFAKEGALPYIRSSYRSELEKKIVNIILSDKYELWTRCTVFFDTEYFNTWAGSEPDGNYYITHPHIDRYNCFGNHRREIEKCAKTMNYIGAIEQISQATMNLNFYDSCVINYLLSHLASHQTIPTWKDTETGEILTTAQVLERNDYEEA